MQHDCKLWCDLFFSCFVRAQPLNVCACSLGIRLAFGCHAALIADVHTDRWDLMVGVTTGGREERTGEGPEEKRGDATGRDEVDEKG